MLTYLLHGRNFPLGKKLIKMKTIITTIAAVAALTAGAFAVPAVTGATTTPVVVAADEQTVTLDVSGLR